MKLIVGLGNPGKIYINSRHNIGFSVIKSLSQLLDTSFKAESRALSIVGKGRIKNKNIILAMPLTFMNLSGLAVCALVKKYKIDLPRLSLKSDTDLKEERDLDNLLVVCDDLDLEFGRMKIRPRGSSGGHRGLQSIMDYLGGGDFARLRIGIGRPRQKADAAGYVLSVFTREEKEQVKKTIREACDCCESWVAEGIAKSMNIFNRRSD
jgi:PTH1 family peptidyl-tRNA hydrolase